MQSERYFDAIAHQWEEMRAGFFSDRVREGAIAAAKVDRGGLDVDVGAGAGFVTEGLIERGARVFAIDRSYAMLAEVRRRLGGREGVVCGAAEATRLPVATEAVDYAFANMVLHHVESPPDLIAEMARVLKPGGMLVLTDLDEHQFDFVRVEHHDRWMGFPRDLVGRWLAEARLSYIRIECAGEDCCAQSAAGAAAARVSIFIASARKAIHEEAVSPSKP